MSVLQLEATTLALSGPQRTILAARLAWFLAGNLRAVYGVLGLSH